MDAIVFDNICSWNPRAFGVSAVVLTPMEGESPSTEQRFFAYLRCMVDRFGRPFAPLPTPDLDSRSLDDWAVDLAGGDTVIGAFWMIECGWRSLQLDTDQERVILLMNRS